MIRVRLIRIRMSPLRLDLLPLTKVVIIFLLDNGGGFFSRFSEILQKMIRTLFSLFRDFDFQKRLFNFRVSPCCTAKMQFSDHGMCVREKTEEKCVTGHNP